MQTSYAPENLRRSSMIGPHGLRFVIAEFIDENDMWSMGFFKFRQTAYELTELPKGIRPSENLIEFMWELLETEDTPVLRSPSGYYHGCDFHTDRSIAMDISILQGYPVGTVEIAQGLEYSLVVSCEGCSRVAFLGLYVGPLFEGTQREQHLWRPVPFPTTLRTNDALDKIYGLLDEVNAELMIFTAQLQ